MRDLPDNVFRANVGCVLVNDDNRVLALERRSITGAWQLPQGGLEEGEAPEAAILREVHEETGLRPEGLEIVSEYPEWIAYELPPDKRNSKVGRGQVQKWFLLRMRGSGEELDLEASGEQEFARWKWTTFDWILRNVVEFRRPTYIKLKTTSG